MVGPKARGHSEAARRKELMWPERSRVVHENHSIDGAAALTQSSDAFSSGRDCLPQAVVRNRVAVSLISW
jgi:hypothetical protein